MAHREIRTVRISHRRDVTSKVVEVLSGDRFWKGQLAATLVKQIQILAKCVSLDE
jgi:hypothetical protein